MIHALEQGGVARGVARSARVAVLALAVVLSMRIEPGKRKGEDNGAVGRMTASCLRRVTAGAQRPRQGNDDESLTPPSAD